jgi:phosphate-selective porin OprO and OprP
MKLSLTWSNLTRGVLVLCLWAAVGLPLTSAAETESERLAKLEAAVKALQEQNAALKREVSELKGASPKKEVSRKTTADGKTYVETTETEKKPVYVTPGASEIKLVLGGFLQPQFEAGDVNAYDGRFPGTITTKVKDRFRLRRARMTITGDFAEQFDFKLEGEFNQADGIGAGRTAYSTTDAWVNWHRFPEAQIKFGQYKAPFGLEQVTSDTKLFTIERSQVTEALTPERQIGIQLWGKPFADVWPEQKDVLTYWAGVFNGNGRNTITNDNNEFMYVARLEAQLFAGKLAGQDVSFKVGGNYFSSRDATGTNVSQVGNLIVGGDGSLSPFVLPSADDREAYGVDATFHFGPLDVIGEYLDERIRPRTVGGAAPAFVGFDASGYYITAGYFIVPKKLQLVAKWESFDPGQKANDNLHSITGGVNYYIHGDDLKLMAGYIHTWSDFRNNHPVFGDDQFNEFLLRLQVLF